MAYACAMGTQAEGEAPPPQARKVVGYIRTKGVPLGALALEDLWRLPAESYKEYVVSGALTRRSYAAVVVARAPCRLRSAFPTVSNKTRVETRVTAGWRW